MKNYSIQEYFIICAACALKGRKPPEIPPGLDVGALVKLAGFHSMDNMLCIALEKLDVPPDAAVMDGLREVRDKAIVKELIQRNEKEWLLHAFSQNGVNVLPLKGAILSDMYPSPGIRRMSDIDMLMETGKMDLVEQIMKSGGYSLEHAGYHYSYLKEPVMNVEMHKSLVGEDSAYYGYYEDIWNRLVPDEKLSCVWNMTWEDYFVYMIAHLAKHWREGGFGVRSVMDIYVFDGAYGERLDAQYVDGELDKLSLLKFKDDLRALARAWFGGEPMTPEIAWLAQVVLDSGTYGTFDKKVEREIDEYKNKSSSETAGKIKYFFHRMFPTKKKMCFVYPCLEKKAWLLPFCWLHRLVQALIFKRGTWKKELKALKK